MRILFPRTGIIVQIDGLGGVNFEVPLGSVACLGCNRPLCNLDCAPSKESRLFEIDLARGKRLVNNGMKTGFEIAVAAVLQLFRSHSLLENDKLREELDLFLSRALFDIDSASA